MKVKPTKRVIQTPAFVPCSHWWAGWGNRDGTQVWARTHGIALTDKSWPCTLFGPLPHTHPALNVYCSSTYVINNNNSWHILCPICVSITALTTFNLHNNSTWLYYFLYFIYKEMESERASETYSRLYCSYVTKFIFKLGQAGSFATLYSHAPCRDVLAELNVVCKITV